MLCITFTKKIHIFGSVCDKIHENLNNENPFDTVFWINIYLLWISWCETRIQTYVQFNEYTFQLVLISIDLSFVVHRVSFRRFEKKKKIVKFVYLGVFG